MAVEASVYIIASHLSVEGYNLYNSFVRKQVHGVVDAGFGDSGYLVQQAFIDIIRCWMYGVIEQIFQYLKPYGGWLYIVIDEIFFKLIDGIIHLFPSPFHGCDQVFEHMLGCPCFLFKYCFDTLFTLIDTQM